ncbi:MAG: tyrosine-type recombinase/integrase, partial [Caldilineaceae bacterium]|nr:tyrosine-type recombinase/integrase [Caldilineaceae bacterium]
DDEAVFRSQKGGALDPSQIWRIVRAAAQRAGIVGHVSPHWFRHSHASHALERGASVALVRDTLGHSSLAVTSMYTHARPTESSALHLAI